LVAATLVDELAELVAELVAAPVAGALLAELADELQAATVTSSPADAAIRAPRRGLIILTSIEIGYA
jgi:hypothetical protein